MKTVLIVITLILIVSCSPNFNKDFTVYRNDKDYKMWITYYGAKKDTIAVNWLLSYQINNNTNRGVKFDWIRKRPKNLLQNALMIAKDSLKLYNVLNKKKLLKKYFFIVLKLFQWRIFQRNF